MKPSISLCICTVDRPALLERCLLSVANGSVLPHTVVVSDDSVDGVETYAVCQRFSFVKYFRGPRRGLCANRNAAIARVDTYYVSLIDDDGIVGQMFFERLSSILSQLPEKTVVSGDVLEYGGRTAPSNPWFLGHFGRPPGTAPLQGINLNCNCLPMTAFRDATFDEALFYGYEDMDLCSNLMSQGYRFVHHPELVNEHVPPPKTETLDDQRYQWTQKARFQTSMMRYLVWENKPALACLYFVVAPVHRIVYALRHGRIRDVCPALIDIITATEEALIKRRKPRII